MSQSSREEDIPGSPFPLLLVPLPLHIVQLGLQTKRDRETAFRGHFQGELALRWLSCEP